MLYEGVEGGGKSWNLFFFAFVWQPKVSLFGSEIIPDMKDSDLSIEWHDNDMDSPLAIESTLRCDTLTGFGLCKNM